MHESGNLPLYQPGSLHVELPAQVDRGVLDLLCLIDPLSTLEIFCHVLRDGAPIPIGRQEDVLTVAGLGADKHVLLAETDPAGILEVQLEDKQGQVSYREVGIDGVLQGGGSVEQPGPCAHLASPTQNCADEELLTD